MPGSTVRTGPAGTPGRAAPVPAGTRVTAITWSGEVHVRGIRGDVDVHSQSGDVEVRDVAANRVTAVVDAAVRATRLFAANNRLDLNAVLDWHNNGSSTRRGLAAAQSAFASFSATTTS